MRILGLTLFCISLISSQSFAENRYNESSPPPSVGWESALKFFTPNGTNSSSAPSSTGSGDSAFQLGQNYFINNQYVSQGVPDPRWGLNLGYEWDQSWYGSGIYLNYVDFEQAQKYSVTGGFYFPSLQSGFPLYFKAHIGLGHYSNDFDSRGMTFDYNASLGFRFYTTHNWLFNIEVGSRNHSVVLKSESAESIVLGSGMAITF